MASLAIGYGAGWVSGGLVTGNPLPWGVKRSGGIRKQNFPVSNAGCSFTFCFII